ncbi:hypothetical protein X975_21953, partial [Stegodyphus mimosarum]
MSGATSSQAGSIGFENNQKATEQCSSIWRFQSEHKTELCESNQTNKKFLQNSFIKELQFVIIVKESTI